MYYKTSRIMYHLKYNSNSWYIVSKAGIECDMKFKLPILFSPSNKPCDSSRVKSGKFGHHVTSDTHLETVEIQMRRLLMSRLIWIFTVCLVNLYFIPIIKI